MGGVSLSENINILLLPRINLDLDIGILTKHCVGVDPNRYLSSPCEISLCYNDTDYGVYDIYGKIEEHFVRFGIRDEFDGSHGIEFLQQNNDSGIEISMFQNNGGFDRMNILNLAAD